MPSRVHSDFAKEQSCSFRGRQPPGRTEPGLASGRLLATVEGEAFREVGSPATRTRFTNFGPIGKYFPADRGVLSPCSRTEEHEPGGAPPWARSVHDDGTPSVDAPSHRWTSHELGGSEYAFASMRTSYAVTAPQRTRTGFLRKTARQGRMVSGNATVHWRRARFQSRSVHRREDREDHFRHPGHRDNRRGWLRIAVARAERGDISENPEIDSHTPGGVARKIR